MKTFTAGEMAKAIGKQGQYRISSSTMTCLVEVLDAKQSYGTVRLLVAPVKGTGSSWVSAEHVLFPEKETREEAVIKSTVDQYL